MSSGSQQYRHLVGEDVGMKRSGQFKSGDYPIAVDSSGASAGSSYQLPANERKSDLMPWRIRESGHEQTMLIERNEKMTLLLAVARHDISNQLAALQLYLDLLVQDDPGDPRREYYRKFSEGFDQIWSILRFTKDYVDVGMQVSVWHDLKSLVNAAAGSLKGSPVTIITDIPAVEIYADPMIERVFYNLFDNAVRYGGTITRLTVTTRRNDSGLVIVCEDDGIGIPDEQKEQIFRKGFGKHTGFGLFFAREILKSTGITIRETGLPGNGARFEIVVTAGTFRAVRL